MDEIEEAVRRLLSLNENGTFLLARLTFVDFHHSLSCRDSQNELTIT